MTPTLTRDLAFTLYGLLKAGSLLEDSLATLKVARSEEPRLTDPTRRLVRLRRRLVKVIEELDPIVSDTIEANEEPPF